MISAHYARVMFRELVAAGYREQDILGGSSLSANDLWSLPKIDPNAFFLLLENAKELMGERPLAQVVGGNNRIAALGMMGMAMMAAPTLGDGLRAMTSFSGVEADYLHFQVAVGRETSRIELESDRDLGTTLELHVEAVFLIIQDYLTDIVGNTLHGLAYSVTYQRTQKHSNYPTLFKGHVHFGCSKNNVSFPSSWLKIRSPFHNPDSWQLARRQLSEQLRTTATPDNKPFSRHLRQSLRAQQPPLPDIATTADSLHMSQRTLNRRLMQEGTNYRLIKLEATHSWAQYMLREGASVESIALELGYENAANFRRSFREFVGCSPSEWLKDQNARLTRDAP